MTVGTAAVGKKTCRQIHMESDLTIILRVLLHPVFPDRDADEVGVLVAQAADPQVVGGLDVFDVLPLRVTLETDLESLGASDAIQKQEVWQRKKLSN